MDTLTFIINLKNDQFVFLLSFASAVFFSVFPGHLIVRRLYDFILHNTRTHDRTKTLQQLMGEFYGNQNYAEHKAPASGLIGCLERTIYIFGLMFGQTGIITAVVILKAFFNWATEAGAAAAKSGVGQGVSINSVVAVYYVYLIGNFLSLIVALVLGGLGIWLFPRLLYATGVACHALCNVP